MLDRIFVLKPFKDLRFEFHPQEDLEPYLKRSFTPYLLTAGATWLKLRFPSQWALFVAARMQGKDEVTITKHFWWGFNDWPRT